jgi:dTDP-4-amino-4,6-dideoxygalactose transaminase
MFEGALISRNIPQTSPRAFFDEHRQEIMAAVVRVFDRGNYVLGEEVRAFEQEFARAFGFPDAAGVANGTDAVALALRALGIRAGDRVATVSHTAVATVAAIEMAGAEPVFVDIADDTCTMHPAALARTLEKVDGVRAVVAVHLYGHPADAPAIVEIAARFGARVVEDCAQAHGAKWNGQFVGTFGDAAAFSFYPTKNLGCAGDGGMVAANNVEYIEKVRMLRQYGWDSQRISHAPGVNSRLDELQAAILRVSLRYLDSGNRRRAAIAALYDSSLSGTGLKLPVRRPGATHVYHQYAVRSPHRDRFRERLKEQGIDTSVHYPVPVHRQPCWAGKFRIDPGGLETTESVARDVLSLPVYPELDDAMAARVVDAITRLTRE